VIECPVPNAEIYKWDARIRLTEEGQWLSLSDRQMLLAATNLRNCEWAYGIVVYTGANHKSLHVSEMPCSADLCLSGNETKVGKNKRVPVTKYTATDNFINRLSMFIFGLQLSLVIVLAIAGWVVQVKERKDVRHPASRR
jgi:phospholipid-translocating ATPase